MEMQALRGVKGKKNRKIDHCRGLIKESTKLTDEEVAELFSMKKDIEDMKEELKGKTTVKKARTSTKHWESSRNGSTTPPTDCVLSKEQPPTKRCLRKSWIIWHKQQLWKLTVYT